MRTEKRKANPADKADTPTASTRDDRTTKGTGTVNAQRFLTQELSNFNSIAREHFNNNGGGSNKMYYCEAHRRSKNMEALLAVSMSNIRNTQLDWLLILVEDELN